MNASKLPGLFVMNKRGTCGIPLRGMDIFFLYSSYSGPGYKGDFHEPGYQWV